MNRTVQTRCAREATHLLHTPDTFVRTPMPEIQDGSAIIHASPALGAQFLWFTAELEEGGTLALSENERFVYVLDGEGALEPDLPDETPRTLKAGWFAYLPPEVHARLTAHTSLRAVVIEKIWEPLTATAPQFFIGEEPAVEAESLGGDPSLSVRALILPGGESDFAVNTMVYAPGAMLSQVEVHYMEHGLLMLEGCGTYLLNGRSYEVRAGDFIWMQAYCPQWFQASADGPAKYIIYKDFNRKPRL